MFRRIIFAVLLVTFWSCGGGGGGGASPVLFELLVENISTPTTLQTSGEPAPVFFSPGIFAVHEGGEPVFTAGLPARANGLEALAEDGDPTALIESLEFFEGVALLGIVQTPVGTESPSILGPGQSYRAILRGTPGSSLSFAFGFLQGNDLFVAPSGGGIPLFDADGNAVSAVLTPSVSLWDAGTEVNQAPGEGRDQTLRQAATNTGSSESRAVGVVADGFSYPAVSSMIRITLTPQ